MASAHLDAPAGPWDELANMIIKRRAKLGLSRPGAIRRTEGKVSESTWGSLERCEATRYERRKLLAVCKALRWSDDSIEKFISEGRAPVEVEPEETTTDDRLDRLEARLDEMAARIEAVLRRLGVARNGAPPPQGV